MSSEPTKRRNDCIISGDPARSSEHVFPSALGGRRENRGIYCAKHNTWLGVHVGPLQQQLGLFNALLGVEPDRGTIKPFTTTSKSGEKVSFLRSDMRVQPDLDKILDAMKPDEPSPLEIDPVYLDALSSRAAERGMALKIGKQTGRSSVYQLGGQTVSLSFGGEDAMRAIAYLALTFVAHFWPDAAREAGLAAVKAMIRGGTNYKAADRQVDAQPFSDFVFWVPVVATPAQLVHPTGLGHTIIICVRDGQLMAYVSLLDINVAKVLLGCVGAQYPDRTKVIHVDPLQTHFGTDWTIHDFDEALLDETVDAAYLKRAVLDTDAMQRQTQAVMLRVMMHRARMDARRVVDEFRAALDLPAGHRSEAIEALVRQQGQRIVNMIGEIATGPKLDEPMALVLRSGATMAIQPDPTSHDGLNQLARRVLNEVVEQLTARIVDLPADVDFGEDAFLHVFVGDIGWIEVKHALLKGIEAAPSAYVKHMHSSMNEGGAVGER